MKRKMLLCTLALFVFADAAAAQRRLAGEEIDCPDPTQPATISVTPHPLASWPENLGDLVKTADVIVWGTVQKTYPVYGRFPENPCYLYSESEITVQKTINSQLSKFLMPTVRVRQWGMKVGKFTYEVVGQPLMQKGENYILFLNYFSENDVLYLAWVPWGKFGIKGDKIFPQVEESWTKPYRWEKPEKLISDIAEILAAK